MIEAGPGASTFTDCLLYFNYNINLEKTDDMMKKPPGRNM